MARKQAPYLIRGGLSGSIYVVTRSMKRENHAGKVGLVALEKYDVTNQFNELVAPLVQAARRVLDDPFDGGVLTVKNKSLTTPEQDLRDLLKEWGAWDNERTDA